MKIDKVRVFYFSPTGGTKKLATRLGSSVGDKLGVPVETASITLKNEREITIETGPEDLVILAAPTYAGRVPNKIEPDLRRMFRSNGSPAVALASFGNRSYGTALAELADILECSGSRVIGAGAFVSRHVFTDSIARKRPDREDKAELESFAEKIAAKIGGAGVEFDPEELSRPELGDIGPYYRPLKEDGTTAVFLKAKPLTKTDNCYYCGMCVKSCPMGAIDKDCVTVSGTCIKCHACVRCCPEKAKFFDNEDFLSHVRMLEQNYTSRSENAFFI